MTPQAELNESLLKKIGFKHAAYRTDVVGKAIDDCWLEPGYETQVSGHWSFNGPDLVSDIGACFKWIVPELRKKGTDSIEFIYTDRDVSALITPLSSIPVWASADTESKALCLAADKFLQE